MKFSYLHSHVRSDNVVPFARLSESVGADGFWIGDSDMEPDPYILLALAAGQTKRIRLGICVTNPVTRHVATTARAISTLQKTAEGRAVLGIGRGSSALRAVGERQPKTSVMTDAIVILKRLLSGETVDFKSDWASLEKAKLSEPPAVRPPLYVTAYGPRMLEAAGRVADGVIISVGPSPECVRYAVGLVRAGAKSAGRSPEDVKIASHLISAVDRDRKAALEMVRAEATFFIRTKPYLAALVGIESSGSGPSGKKAISLRELEDNRDKIEGLVGDEAVELFTVAGTPHDCADKLRLMAEEGVGEVIWSLKTRWEEMATTIAREIMPSV